MFSTRAAAQACCDRLNAHPSNAHLIHRPEQTARGWVVGVHVNWGAI